MIKVELNQSELPPSARLSERAVREVMRQIERRVKSKPSGMLSVAFVGATEMRRLNRRYRKKDKVTDVLAFPYEDELLGEVLICYPEAKRQAAERGHSVREEVLDLLIHGTLHVLGYDHETTKEAQVMLPLQKRVFESL